ncbi:hypothetical protein [Bartonella sp. ML70XJBT.G]|uniref:hypothetical protein n=1 Tax=Bartonella sp. ML70XJBT.G TaxID=3019093 RepID=UPI00235FFB5C|nr:hypothetical protein [Bartonella sp. ML70XJBT.G]
MNTISFLSYKYKIDTDSELVNTNCNNEFLKEGKYHPTLDNQCATLIIEKFSMNLNTYYWIYVLMGEESPYNPEVIDSKNGFQKIPNPRPKEYVEQNQQYFGILIPKEFTLFSSNQKLNKFLQLHYKESSSNKVLDISPALVDKQNFEKKLRSIKEIKLKYTPPRQSDFFGIPSEEDLLKIAESSLGSFPTEGFTGIELSLDIKFKEKNSLKNFFHNFINKDKTNPVLKKISFVGNTYNNFNIIFNTKTFQHKVNIKADKNVNGMYSEDTVKNELKYKIKNFTVDF